MRTESNNLLFKYPGGINSWQNDRLREQECGLRLPPEMALHSKMELKAALSTLRYGKINYIPVTHVQTQPK